MAAMLQVGAPPPSPPEVTNQFGAYGAGASALRERMRGRADESVADTQAANPQGALMAQAEALKKVLDQMARQSPVFAPFASRAREVVQAGLEAALQASGGPGGQGGPGTVSAPPTVEVAGGGFP